MKLKNVHSLATYRLCLCKSKMLQKIKKISNFSNPLFNPPSNHHSLPPKSSKKEFVVIPLKPYLTFKNTFEKLFHKLWNQTAFLIVNTAQNSFKHWCQTFVNSIISPYFNDNFPRKVSTFPHIFHFFSVNNHGNHRILNEKTKLNLLPYL